MPGRTPVLSEAQFSTAHEAGGVRELTGRAPVWPRSPHSLFPPLPTVQLSPARPHGGLAAAADPGGYAPLPRGSEGGGGNVPEQVQRCQETRPAVRPGTSGRAGAGRQPSPPAARSLQEAANRPLSSDTRRAMERESPDHRVGAAIRGPRLPSPVPALFSHVTWRKNRTLCPLSPSVSSDL